MESDDEAMGEASREHLSPASLHHALEKRDSLDWKRRRLSDLRLERIHRTEGFSAGAAGHSVSGGNLFKSDACSI